MGNCVRTTADPSRTNMNRGKAQKSLNKEAKLLLLGSGESGKSTVFKQIKKQHGSGYSQEELKNAKNSIYANILLTLRALGEQCVKNNIELEPGNMERAKRMMDLVDNDSSLLVTAASRYSIDVANDVQALWADKKVQEMFNRRYEFHVFDGAGYFFQDIDRLRPPNYTPSFEDILRCRMKTVGIIEIGFQVEDVYFKLFDVGGQRNERKKWIHHFDGVTAVIFVASMSDYDQKCYEDDVTNRMIESMDLFDEMVNGTWFKETTFMLFLNKTDIFREKIKHTDLKVCFPEYDGGCDFDKAAEYVKNKFLSLNKYDQSRIHVHMTEATNTETLTRAFEHVKSLVVDKNKATPV
ncbi:guanine nucleotide-binding protein G(i) subunit alpha [Acrasis kona]|uniref:Guanine nucleotide-binding protein G(I) subunit alpha n=1 Tax=Acrasis kona TaxID=1008807 RepID=A0AAW2YSM5_9EUKA